MAATLHWLNPIALENLLLDKNQASRSRGLYFSCCHNKTFKAYFDYFWKYCLFQKFQGPRLKFKGLSRAWNLFPQFQNFPGFSRVMAALYMRHIEKNKFHSSVILVRLDIQ